MSAGADSRASRTLPAASGPLHRLPVTALRGVGPRIEARLANLGIRSVQDLLLHLPSRYQDRTRVTPIGELRAGDDAVIVGAVARTRVNLGRRRSLVCRVTDASGALDLRFFHFTRAQRDALAADAAVCCFGEAREGPLGLELVHPEYRLLDAGDGIALEPNLTPVYPTTDGLGQPMMRRLTDGALTHLQSDQSLPELLPEAVRTRAGLPPIADALRHVHRPAAGGGSCGLAPDAERGRSRLVFEELLAHHLSRRLLRRRLDTRTAPALQAEGALSGRFAAGLGFELTHSQRRVIAEIRADLERDRPMHRLVQGDVGCGKTVVAAMAALHAIEAGYQVALMAPTELLAEQHRHGFQAWLAPLGIDVAWLAGALHAAGRRRVLADVAAGAVGLVAGTHALLQDGVTFARLGLIIIDEQHRFGVHQRRALQAKGIAGSCYPHQLVMTATPIPRTLAMTACADLDVSTVDELPPNRRPIETAVVAASRRCKVIARVRQACLAGRQAYWLCTLVEDSDALQARAAEQISTELGEALPDLRVSLVHGRMKARQKDLAMGAFKAGHTDLLVATTVIEVGVDVPNATMMVVENAERLGLAQLHQLRGRIGRGEHPSACVLMYHSPLSAAARRRLEVLRSTNDGFEIAERDLELRGPGELLGTRQTGVLPLRIADLSRDRGLLGTVSRTGAELFERDPRAAQSIVERWVDGPMQYAEV